MHNMEHSGCGAAFFRQRSLLLDHLRMRLRHSNFRSFRIDQQLLADQEGRSKEIQLLLLGGQNTGKNTMIKQLRIHFGDGFPTKVRKIFVHVLLANLADAVCIVLQEMHKRNKEFSDPYAKELAKEILDNRPDEGFVHQVKLDDFASSEVERQSPLIDAGESTTFGNTEDQPPLNLCSEQSLLYSKMCNQLELHNEENSNFLKDFQQKLSNATPGPSNLRNRYAEFARVGLLGSEVEVEDNLGLANWLEYSLNYCPFSDRHAQKVMSILAERTRNPQICKLPSELAAQLPPPTHLPPTPPSLSLLDLQSTALTGSDKWSSTTTFEMRNQRFGSQSEGGSIHSMQKETYGLSIPNEYASPRRQSRKHSSKSSGPYHDSEQATTSGLAHLTSAEEPKSDTFNWSTKNGAAMTALSTLCWLTKNLKVLTDQPEFQELINSKTVFPISIATSSFYFIKNVDRFIQNDYLPALQDILMMQMPRRAIQETAVRIGPSTLRLIHLGQQKGDRRKWIHLFETVNAIFFFASLTDFMESGSTPQFKSKMDESLDYFLFLLHSVCLSKKDIIIFFTKMDLLPEVFEKTSVQSVYENYEGEETVTDCVDFFQHMFLSQCKDAGPRTRKVYAHSVCLLDIDAMKTVCKLTIKCIYEANLRKHAIF